MHIIDGCATWPAMKSWQDKEYLSSNFGTRLMQPMAITSETRYPAGKYTYDKFIFDVKDAHPTNMPMSMRYFITEMTRIKDRVIKDPGNKKPGEEGEIKPRPDSMQMIYLDSVASSI